ncbi:hypothetical protein FV228_00210 [Methylobacterium sp. WL18]|nr:hypothetical protein FV228_00210 [Methylobacterium sp. WL18]
MQILLSQADLDALPAQTRHDILTHLLKGTRLPEPAPAPAPADSPSTIDPVGEFVWEQRVNFSPAEIATWMGTASENTKLGLRLIAEHGPIVDARLLYDAGLGDLRHFQSRTTIRTRTITGNPHAFMLSWDNWEEYERDADGLRLGRYAVTPITHASLRRYFGLV